jgi:two-component system sensor histidine kinase VicK
LTEPIQRTKREGERLPEKTEVLQGAENIRKFVIPRYAAIKDNMDTCQDYHGPIAVTAAEPIWQELLKLEKRRIKIRFLTDITKENITACKKFLILRTSELRHLAGVKGNYAIADRREYFESTISEGDEQPVHGIFTTVRGIVDSRQFLFDNLWNKGIPAEERMKEIEEGIQHSFTETMRDPLEIQKIAFDLIKYAKEEIQMISPTANIVSQEAQEDILLKLLADKIEVEDNNIKVRILFFTDTNDNNNSSNNYLRERIKNKIEIQHIKPSLLQKTFSTLIVDRKYLLVLESKDDTTNSNSFKSIDIATYSNSEATVSSYSTVFETLWIKSELSK